LHQIAALIWKIAKRRLCGILITFAWRDLFLQPGAASAIEFANETPDWLS
jgi:hypothetical protein